MSRRDFSKHRFVCILLCIVIMSTFSSQALSSSVNQKITCWPHSVILQTEACGAETLLTSAWPSHGIHSLRPPWATVWRAATAPSQPSSWANLRWSAVLFPRASAAPPVTAVLWIRSVKNALTLDPRYWNQASFWWIWQRPS